MIKQQKTNPQCDINITNGCVLIAKYMGIYPIKATNEQGKDYYYYNNFENHDFEALPQYNEDWVYLMNVVEKINRCELVSICDGCRISALKKGEFPTINIVGEGQPLIKSVFEAVVKYVEWYMSNN